jgi:predicted enzyme related to lactoylglutathione lyase
MLSDFTLSASIPASDISRAKAFYRDKLDLKPFEENSERGEARYRTGDSMFLLYQSEFAGTNKATAASWQVDDLDAMVKELRGRGVVFEDYEVGDFKTMDGILSLPEGSKVAWFKDSEGNILGIFQE